MEYHFLFKKNLSPLHFVNLFTGYKLFMNGGWNPTFHGTIDALKTKLDLNS